MPSRVPDLGLLRGVVADPVLAAMREASKQLSSLGIRHALVGALAVGAYGYPRASADVDFLIGDEAFDHHGAGIISLRAGVPIRVGNVPIDALSIAQEESHLACEIEAPQTVDGIPVASAGAVVYLKLKSPRTKDAGDVVEMLRRGIEAGEVRPYLQRHAPDLVSKFDRLVAEADA